METRLKILVPEKMMEACEADGWHPSNRETLSKTLEVAIRWLSENPIAPSSRDIKEISMHVGIGVGTYDMLQRFMIEWQRRMFLAPETKPLDIPNDEEMKNLHDRWISQIDETGKTRLVDFTKWAIAEWQLRNQK